MGIHFVTCSKTKEIITSSMLMIQTFKCYESSKNITTLYIKVSLSIIICKLIVVVVETIKFTVKCFAKCVFLSNKTGPRVSVLGVRSL